MTDEMGSFRTEVEIENRLRPGERVLLPAVRVDTGAELSWFPAGALDGIGIERTRLVPFRVATGAIVERWTGVAIVHVAGVAVGDQVVFGEPGDLMLLGSRSLEGLNLVVNPINKRLVDAGALHT